MKDKILNALAELKKGDKKNFSQSVDLIINLKDFDTRKDSLNLFVEIPHQTSEKKVCAFLEKPNTLFDYTILKIDFDKWKDKKQIKKLGRNYDFFAAVPQVMAQVATVFGRVLGPLGKMPSPQLGVLTNTDDASVKELMAKMKKTVRIKTKEASIKVLVGKETMNPEYLADNAVTIYNAVVNALPKKRESIKSVLIKLTMSKPVKIEVK